MLIDTHIHLDKYKNYNELYKYIISGNNYFLCMTTSPKIYYACIHTFEENKHLRFALGMHPLESSGKDLLMFEKYLGNTRYIGEIGLDIRSRNKNQIEILEKVFSLSCNNDKIYSIHCNKMEKELCSIVSKFQSEKIIIHWYHGDRTNLEKLINLGCYFSVNLSMIADLRKIELVKCIPLKRILIESDGPYTRVNNHMYFPYDLEILYKKIADCLEYEQNFFVKQVEENFRRILAKK